MTILKLKICKVEFLVKEIEEDDRDSLNYEVRR